MKNFCYFMSGVIITLIFCTIYTGIMLNKYKAYYNAAEKVLDNTFEVYDSFLDTVGESDAYCDYVDARDKIAQ